MYKDHIDSKVHSQDGNTVAIWYAVPSPEREARISEGLTANWSPYGPVAPESPQMVSPFCSSMELVAHFRAGRPDRALTLLRTMWGYIWNSPYAVQSSLIEGYYHDGRCHYPFGEYDPAYISHAHPWASGPTIALSFWLVGLRFSAIGHESWVFEPRISLGDGQGKSPEWAMTGFTSNAQGFFSAGYKWASPGELVLAIKSPETTVGKVGLPTIKKTIKSATSNGDEIALDSLDKGTDHLFVSNVKGGNRIIIIKYEA